jgi:hypothetical protein
VAKDSRVKPGGKQKSKGRATATKRKREKEIKKRGRATEDYWPTRSFFVVFS